MERAMNVEDLQRLRLENARLRIRVADLEDACRAARRALRKVRQLASRIPDDRRDMPKSCSRALAAEVVSVDHRRGIVTLRNVEDATHFTRHAFDGNGSEVT